MMLNPNCSEAIVRIDLREMNEPEVMLKLKLEKAIKEYSDTNTWIYETKIFDIPILKINGDMPFNQPDTITDILEKYNTKYEITED